MEHHDNNGIDLVIGAGVTGLSYAAATDNDYCIIEKENEAGGYCRTIRQDGFVWDYAGHFFHFQNEGIKERVMGRMNPADILTVKKETQIRYKKKLIDFPFQKNIHQLDKPEFIDCLYDLFNAPAQTPTTFKEMLYAKFGGSIAEKFLIPYNEKLYACDLNTLDINAMGRFFPYADKEEIIANFKTHEQEPSSYNNHFLYPKGGAIEYIKSIMSGVDASKIHYGEHICSIDKKNHLVTTNKRTLKYDNLLSTIPFPQLLKLSATPYDEQLYTCNKVLVFNIGFNKKGLDQKNNWVYYPEQKYIFYRVGFYDNIFGSDKLSVYVEIGYKENEEIDQAHAYARTLEDMKKANIISDHEVESMCAIVMDPAYVHVTANMEQDRAAQMKALAKYDIYSRGRYGSWIYCSIEDNIRESMALAARLSSSSCPGGIQTK